MYQVDNNKELFMQQKLLNWFYLFLRLILKANLEFTISILKKGNKDPQIGQKVTAKNDKLLK